ncbi:MAG: histidine kinase dimerization/phosphoacceptor domain -containing protein [Candidatus Methanofastidiosia archaeon]|jgi:PAS domain S-box-containing protein
MNIYAFSSLLASYVCFPLALLVYQNAPKNKLNKIFALSCTLLGCLAFTEFGLRQATNTAAAYTWIKLGAFWPLVISIYLHFILIFTNSKTLQKKVTYFLLHAPALTFTVLALTTSLISGEPIKEYWGFMYTAPENPIIHNISGVWAFLLTTLPLILCFLYYYRTEESIEKQRAKYVLLAIFVPVIVISASKGVFSLTGTSTKVPDLSITAITIEFIIITYGIYKFNLFALTPAVAADDIVAAMSNVLFLVRKDGRIALANKSALHLLGYTESELIGTPLQRMFAAEEWEEIQKSDTLNKNVSNKETAIRAKDGRLIPVLVSLSVVRDKYGSNLGYLCIVSDLTDHKQAEEAQRKEVLLKEIHHRVKNNMQIISSLLSLQSNYITDEKYKEMLKESQNRIKSMALIHEKLYQSKDLENINFKEYITTMVNELARSYKGQGIALTVDVDNISFGVDIAVPCGLIINELVSNALKHAFPDKKGEIKVGLHTGDGVIKLQIADNGVGIPEDMNFRTTETLGLRLVTILAEDQLKGEIRLNRDKGTEFCIVFRK